MPAPSGVDESDGGLELRAEEYGSTHFGGYAVGTSSRGASKPYDAAEVGFCPGRSNVANLADWIASYLRVGARLHVPSVPHSRVAQL